MQRNGLQDAHQGEIGFGFKFNASLATNLFSMGLETQTVYPARAKEVLDIRTGEFCYVQKMDKRMKSAPLPGVLTSFNGSGAVAATLFPNNPELQTQAIMNSIRVIGSAFDNVPFLPGQSRSGDITVQVAGVRSRIAKHVLSPGTFLEYYLPTIKDLSNGNNVREPNMHPDKVTLEVRPFDHKLAAERVILHIRSVIYEQERWKAAMNPNYRSTQSWLSMSESFLAFSQFAGLLFLNQFGFDFAKAVYNDGARSIPSDDDIRKKVEHTVLVLAQRLGTLASSVTLPFPPENSLVLPDIDDENVLEDKKRRFLGSVFWDGQIMELGFGYVAGSNQMKGVDQNTQKLQVSTAYGNFLHQQLNTAPKLISGLVDAFRRQQENIAGMVVRGASEGQQSSFL